MSVNVTIQEGGVGQNLSLDVLRVPKLGGGTEDLVPEDGKNLVNIRVKQNGTYKASDFGAYGISEVRVACTLNGGSATSEAVTKDISEAFNPAPAEGGIARIFTAKRIETLLSGGGSCQWLQKGDVSLGTKSINVDNTTYRAADDGYYGYSQVTVSGISITKTTDGDGNEVIEHTDGTGTVTEVVPSSIAVITPPTRVLYRAGDTIDYTGIVVKAYKANGDMWSDASYPNGTIPITELILSITIAEGQLIATAGESAELIRPEISPAPISTATYITKLTMSTGNGYHIWLEGSDVIYSAAFISSNEVSKMTLGYVSRSPFKIYRKWTSLPNPPRPENYSSADQYTLPDGTVCYISGTYSTETEVSIPFKLLSIGDSYVSYSDIAKLVFMGTLSTDNQELPVQWERPGDNQLLETSFTITVS